MKAFRVAVGILCSLILATGCTLCQNPYYDCGPVWSRGTSVNCNPDYRSGSVLNRQGVPVTDDAARASQPASRTTVPAGIAAHRSDESEPRVHSTTLAQQRQTAKPQPADQRTTRTSPESGAVATAPSPKDVALGTVPAPPGTKEGDTRVLSVTDRRLDELQRTPNHLADGRKSPKQAAEEKTNEDLDGWRTAAPHQDPMETAAQLREIDR